MGAYQLRILDGRGQVVDELASRQSGLAGLATGALAQSQVLNNLERLWTAARDSASSPNPLLDTILREVRGF